MAGNFHFAARFYDPTSTFSFAAQLQFNQQDWQCWEYGPGIFWRIRQTAWMRPNLLLLVSCTLEQKYVAETIILGSIEEGSVKELLVVEHEHEHFPSTTWYHPYSIPMDLFKELDFLVLKFFFFCVSRLFLVFFLKTTSLSSGGESIRDKDAQRKAIKRIMVEAQEEQKSQESERNEWRRRNRVG